ncbi:MAG: hypothetical protein WBQ24_08845 [Xanthobacteraceae bacterium]
MSLKARSSAALALRCRVNKIARKSLTIVSSSNPKTGTKFRAAVFRVRKSFPWGQLQMRKNKKPKTQRKAVRTRIFDKRFVVTACATAAVLCGIVYFRSALPALSLSSADSHQTAHNVPAGSILIPYGNGDCRLKAIDNTTGQIQDDGLMDCADAADQNTVAWKPLANVQKATEIRKSFRHE